MTPRPLSECKPEDLTNNHALVFGRVKVWTHDLTDESEMAWQWSKYAWWKAMWSSHRGPPSESSNWGVYVGTHGYSGTGDAQLSHWLPMPPDPRG